jgi:hypothetical protein
MYYACCKILGVKPGSDINTIKAAYRKAAKELHPDINHFENASQYFIILQDAYKYLINHPFNDFELERMQRAERIKQSINLRRQFYNNTNSRPNPFVNKTLQEVLAKSLTARIVYIFFHILFLFLGLYMIFGSVYDVIYYPVDPLVSAGSAYIAIIFAFFFGITITVIFLFSGISSIRRR